MRATERPIAPPGPVAVVEAVWLAQRQGRTEDMLALIHPDVVWHPLTRPGRSTYNGHEGTLQMLADYAKALGPYWMDWTELSELPDGSVHARGRVIRETDDGEVADPPVEAVIRLRDGLFASLDSNTSTDN